ncbi:MAG: ATP-binding protein [Candidatus Aenigmatarchaeota archaeon]
MEKVRKIQRLTELIIKDSPVLFLGDRGIGKTSIAFDIAKNLGLEPFYLNVSQLSPEHLSFPVIRDDNLDFRTIDLEGKLVILDELTNRNPDLHSALQSLVLDKRIGNKKFENVYFLATGNRPENSYLAVELPRPLIERFVVIDFPIPSKEEWAIYTLNKGGNTGFVNFIMQAPDDLFYSPASDSALEQVPSPRNNTRTALLLSKIIGPNNLDKNNIDEIKLIVLGSSGRKLWDAFYVYLESGRYYSYKYFLKGDYPKNNNEVIQLIVDSTNLHRQNEISLKDWVNVFEFVYQNYQKLAHYMIDYYKLNFDNAKNLVIFAKENPNSSLYKIVEERRKFLAGQ